MDLTIRIPHKLEYERSCVGHKSGVAIVLVVNANIPRWLQELWEYIMRQTLSTHANYNMGHAL